MKCTIKATLSYIYICTAAGSAYGIISKGLQYFSPTLIITLRMFFGFLICLLIFFLRFLFLKKYKNNFLQQLFPGKIIIYHMCISGLLYQGIAHTLIATTQQWVNSAIVQMVFPLDSVIASIFSHFFFEDEKFTLLKLYSLILAFLGVIMTAIPSFKHPSPGVTITNIIIGYLFLFIAVFLWGLSTVYMKLKTSTYDGLITGIYQLLSSFFICGITSIIYDGPKKIIYQCLNTPLIGWLSPIIVGIFASGLIVLCAIILVKEIGAVAGNFPSFGQIIIGIFVGVIWLKEWKFYSIFDIIITLLGTIFLIIGIYIGFSKDENKENEPLLTINEN